MKKKSHLVPLMCARATFVNEKLTVSILHEAGDCLIDTIEIFRGYFLTAYPEKKLHKIELFLNGSEMHWGADAWQTTYF
jgi:hypothetical protein